MFNFFRHPDETKGQRDEPLPPPNEGLPDSSVNSGLCPRCMKQSSFEVLKTLPVTWDGGFRVHPGGQEEPTFSDQVSVLLCRHCNQGVVVVEEQYLGEPEPRGGQPILHRGIYWWPLPNATAGGDVPAKIDEAYAEAHRALAARCPRAAVVMARRSLEAVADHLGEKSGTLFKQLQALEAAGKLHPTLLEWATEIRLLGNAGAHFDPIEEVTLDEAKQLVDFTREFLRYVFEFPAQLQRMKSRGGSS